MSAGKRIETERRQLQKAAAILGCVVLAIQHDADDIDIAAAVLVALQLVETAEGSLDSVALRQGGAP